MTKAQAAPGTDPGAARKVTRRANRLAGEFGIFHASDVRVAQLKTEDVRRTLKQDRRFDWLGRGWFWQPGGQNLVAATLVDMLVAVGELDFQVARIGVLRCLNAAGAPRFPDTATIAAFAENHPGFVVQAGKLGLSPGEPAVASWTAQRTIDAFERVDGSLATRAELVKALTKSGLSKASSSVLVTHDPLVEPMATNVFRLRGRACSPTAIERLRRLQNTAPMWNRWARVSDDALWVEVKVSQSGPLLMRLSNDVLFALAERRAVDVFAIDGSPLGEARLHRGKQSELELLGLKELLGPIELPVAIRILFEFAASRATLFVDPAPDDASEVYPGDSQGCYLVDGTWCGRITVDDRLVAGERRACLPSVLSDVASIELGERRLLPVLRADEEGSRSIEIGREWGPLTIASIAGLVEKPEPGSILFVGLSGEGVFAKQFTPDRTDPRSSFSASIGLADQTAHSGSDYWSAALKRIGGSGAPTKATVMHRLARRHETQLLEIVTKVKAPVSASWGTMWRYAAVRASSPEEAGLSLEGPSGRVRVMVGIASDAESATLGDRVLMTEDGLVWVELSSGARQELDLAIAALPKEIRRLVDDPGLRSWVVAEDSARRRTNLPTPIRCTETGWVVGGERCERLTPALDLVRASGTEFVGVPEGPGRISRYPVNSVPLKRLETEAFHRGLRAIDIESGAFVCGYSDESQVRTVSLLAGLKRQGH